MSRGKRLGELFLTTYEPSLTGLAGRDEITPYNLSRAVIISRSLNLNLLIEFADPELSREKKN